ncbi:CHASE2 domain-containing protein [Phenylobacterium sp.]|uniref:CHASE2 domain-containing protein n=1 Tax=Phenylobacterium sp. TaxID=1871053 RepID=UPI00271C82DA|nr:CHASE2 domain-containing protein [Phenylobacterium sp.]MDO8377619.1 CHASE2 domain-containing protein [Phenylobacterium sp.]
MPEPGRSPAFRRLLLEWLLVAVLATPAAGVASWNGLLARADGAVYDALALLNGRPADPDLIIVAIDDRSLAELGRWPWPRARHAELLRVLAPMRPKAVIYDVLFTEPDPADADLAKAMGQAGRVYLPVLVAPGLNGARFEHVPPTALLAQAAVGLGHVIIRADADGVVRRRDRCAAPTPRPLAEVVLGLEIPPPPADGAPCVGELIPFAGPPGAYRTVSFGSVLRGEVPAEFFTGRRVLVGATALGMTDHFQTPMDRLGGGMSGVELQANILDALGNGAVRSEAGRPWRLVLAILPLWILMAGFLALKPAQNLGLAIGLGAAVLALSLGLFGLSHLWLSPVTTLAILLLVFPVWGWRRLAMASDFLKAEFERLGGRLEAPVAQAPMAHGPVADVVASQARALSGAISRMDALRRFADDILASLPDATLVTDARGVVIQANAPAHALLGEDLVGARLIDLLRRLEPVALEAEDLTGPHARPLALRDGRTLLLHTASRRGEGEGPAGEVIGLADVTELMATARQREQALQLLTHDMRSPQTSILALLQQSPGLEPTVVGRIAANARRTLALADGFVQFARAEAAALSREPVDLADVVCEMADELWPQAQQKKVTFVQAGCDEPAFTLGERSLLARAFANLFENAVKYSPAGAVIAIALTREAGRIVVSVTDQGPGLTPDEAAAVFEPFQRFDRPQAGDPGAGLGLAFVRSVVVRHGGQVRYETAPGGGARFIVDLPEMV